jgi:hypothetical protein
MKTSTKLLILFLTCIPASVWAYNLLLKRHLNAHQLIIEVRPELDNNRYTEKILPVFKHLVIDGTMVMGEQDYLEKATNWQPRITVGDYKNSRNNTIRLLKGYENVIRTKLYNDTLYISFAKKIRTKIKPYSDENYWDDVLKVRSAQLQSFSGRFGQFNINVNPAIRELRLNMSGYGNLSLQGNKLQRADILLKDSVTSNLNIKCDDLYYTLLGKSQLTLDQQSAGRYHPGLIDSSARISITGYATRFTNMLAE